MKPRVLEACVAAVVLASADGVLGNTEIRNFGPLLCRADEYGHLAVKAADTLSHTWPVLRPGSSPSIFTLQRPPDADSTATEGAWLVLDLSDGGRFTLPSPAEAGMYHQLVPRDRWIRQTMDAVAWFCTKRFSLRASFAADSGVDVHLDLHAPESLLRSGGIEWQAELVDTTTTAAVPSRATNSVPNHAIVSSVVPKETGARKEGSTTVVFSHTSAAAVPTSILASDTIVLDDQQPVPMFPCTKAYLHIRPVRTGVIIPPRTPAALTARGWWNIAAFAERLYGPLSGADEAQQAQTRTYPVHLTLDPLYIGALPRTALTLTPVLTLMLYIGWYILRPTWLTLLNHHDKSDKKE